jgi:hypothetical protein
MREDYLFEILAIALYVLGYLLGTSEKSSHTEEKKDD